ncbi:beta-galactosidase [Hylaeus volcanicus]|uniref:beta-galactosidase n=1 Tax=Hylaeus volcanicus TaxID=313075 RepID=UPI0023B77C18|nr:beta-galactosidase [Hylaeus volcanicus]XP_053978639.1 beta-galactosidase [Hylaeus volcanicus]XP_053978640.1 beta-galactosidase [Hylaeus volcanicus]XP_053978641.1 beta-galactosidase [Hylaeus volcanicus]
MWSLLLTLAVTGAMGEVVNVHVNDNAPKNFSFGVDYENNQFLLDGEPFRYVSGSFHYFRAPRRYWRDRLRKMRAAGLNAVSTYVEWSLHEPRPDVWHWSGDADLTEFLSIAQEEGLMVLLRPGPYICAERDFGGLPYWLLTSIPDIRLRTNDPRYMSFVERYLTKVFEKVNPYLRGNGGPIIMVQVENEYGSYACDTAYMNRLREFMNEKIEAKALLYTTDGNSASMVRCGSVTGAYATVDFGAGSNVTKSFETMRLYQPKGPFVNSEFYPGWLSSWQQPFQRVQASAVTKTLDEMLSLGASVNMYMFFGGTNFGYTSGANIVGNVYQPQLTSYDYDAPLTEAGDPTPKYFLIRDVIAKYLLMPNISLPTVSPKGSYGSVYLSPVLNLFDTKGREKFATIVTHASDPLTFEALDLPHWLALYETNLVTSSSDPATLRATPRDRALVYVGDHLVGTFSRTNNIYDISIEKPYQKDLKLLVENQGRVNYGSGLRDFKGIWNVTLNNTPLRGWTMTGFSLDSITLNDNYPTITLENGTLRRGPVVLRGKFTVSGEPMDTYLNTIGWGKGVAFVNGRNLGRYWPLVGPQVTLYVPAPYLRSGENELVLVELEYVPSSRKMKFQDTPILDQTPRSYKLNDFNGPSFWYH